MLYRCLVFIGLVVLGSCVDEDAYDLDSVTITPNIAFPLASGDLSIKEILSNKDASDIKVYPDGLLYFSYQQTYQSTSVHDLFVLSTNSSTHSFDLIPGTLPSSGTDVLLGTLNRQIDLNQSPQQLSEILLKAGTLTYTIGLSQPTSPVALPFDVVVTMTDVVQNTSLQPLTFTASMGTGTKSLQNYKFNMISNKFNIKLDFIVRAHASGIFIPSNDKINVQFSFGGMDFSYIKGFLGDQTANLVQQTIPINVFNSSLLKSSVSIVQPVVTFSIDDYYGVPAEVNLSKLQAEKASANLPFVISPASPLTLNYPSSMGSFSSTPVTVNNAAALVSFSPTQMVYAGTVRINKGLSSGNNFLTDAPLNITLTTDVPLYGRASNLSMADTLKMDFQNLDESNISNAFLKINATNQLPLDTYIQFYLTDKNYTVLDSLIAPNQSYFVKASTVNGSGELQSSGTTDTKIDLTQAKVNKLFSSNYLIIKAKLNTTRDSNGTLLNVKFKADYKLKLTVGMNAKLKITAK